MIRTFIGIELDEQTRSELAEEIAYLQGAAPKVRWVPPENLHITLKFLGDVPPNDLQEIFDAVSQVASTQDAFALNIEGLGCFPNPHIMRVVWAGCGMGADELTRLAQATDNACAELGYDPERRSFSPHLTLGRVKEPRHAAGLDTLLEDGKRQSFGIVDVDALVVFMSERKRGGPVYTAMHHALLR